MTGQIRSKTMATGIREYNAMLAEIREIYEVSNPIARAAARHLAVANRKALKAIPIASMESAIEYVTKEKTKNTKRKYRRRKTSSNQKEIQFDSLKTTSKDWVDNLTTSQLRDELRKRIKLIEELRTHRDSLLNALTLFQNLNK